ncbi:MAG: C10 family peptidase, partial [Bacteroidota bacterium]
MMKKIIILLFFPVYLFSQTVDQDKAARVAENFLRDYETSNPVKTKLSSIKIINERPVYYVFDINDENGFIIISADYSFSAVIGYSLYGRYNPKGNIPGGLTSLLKGVEDQVLQLRDSGLYHEKYINEWNKYLTFKKSGNEILEHGPLLKSKWNQDCGYNEMAPVDAAGPCGHAYAGCIALAVAQIMKYWSFPGEGTGTHEYDHSTYGTLQADFNHTYHWDSMPDTASNHHIASLLFDVGVSLETDYGPSGSGATPNYTFDKLKRYFKYSNKFGLLKTSGNSTQGKRMKNFYFSMFKTGIK